MIRQSIAEPLAKSAHEKRPGVIQTHEQLRKRAANAYIRLPAQGNKIASAIGKHHTSVVHRKKGEGPLLSVLEEIEACERRGICTDSFLYAILETQLTAREALGDACPVELSRQMMRLDHAEDEARHRMLSREPGGRKTWVESLVRYIAHATQTVMALGKHGEAHGPARRV